jgi:hypothetical protein
MHVVVVVLVVDVVVTVVDVVAGTVVVGVTIGVAPQRGRVARTAALHVFMAPFRVPTHVDRHCLPARPLGHSRLQVVNCFVTCRLHGRGHRAASAVPAVSRSATVTRIATIDRI